MINRQLEHEIMTLTTEFPVIAILGPRQSGKTTLAKYLFSDYRYISFEDYDVRDFAEHDPRGFLERYDHHCIFDEIQRVPHIMSYLQTHIDAHDETGNFIITGSHNFFLMEQISQSLAGRVGITRLLPFSIEEISELSLSLEQLIFSGFYPRIHDKGIRPRTFYKNYLETYIEKDIRQLKNITKIDQFRKFLYMLAGRAGQELNLSTLSEECGVSHNTLADWVSVLEASFIIYRIKPFHKNYNKRLVKRQKLYFYDTGLLCNLLGIRKKEELDYHFLKGSIFENFVINEFVKQKYNHDDPYELYFWRDNHKKEIDLILESGQQQLAVEIKSGKTFRDKFFEGLNYWQRMTGSAPEDLYLIYSGNESFTRNNMHVTKWDDIYKQIISRVL